MVSTKKMEDLPSRYGHFPDRTKDTLWLLTIAAIAIENKKLFNIQ